jgi:hypothetical protein
MPKKEGWERGLGPHSEARIRHVTQSKLDPGNFERPGKDISKIVDRVADDNEVKAGRIRRSDS